ncbi:FAD-binding oxidoreductase [Actinokineospora bangkokensis]|uniref:FAD-binding oxidoreductase n=1 Tax=Actinokineospora bangkokensis TaxID=1193682 RepID=UPI001E5EEB4A|nr:FAD-dependent oxidoreductase [Actinokineospora bangkokensis]
MSLPNDRGFAAAHRLYNPAFDANTPAAVARPTTAEHVQACVETASAARIPIAARSGGHSYAGYSAPQDGLVVDLRAMNAVQVNADGTATVQAGARLIEVYTALAAQGRALPGGTCPSVGIAGLTLGGGIGVLTRKFGLTCDRLVSAKLVTADGTLRTVNAQSEPDLYWALRGGGGGNFGIVTEFTFSTEPAPQLTTFNLPFGAGTAPQVLGAWQEWVAGAPAELWSAVTLSARQTSVLSGCFVGTENGLTQQLAPLLRAIGANPTRRVVQTRDYLGAMKYYAGCSGCDPDSVARQSFTASSRVLGAPVRDTGAFAALLDGTSEMDVLIDSLGGAVAAVAPAASAFPHRQALATVQIYQKGNNPQAVARVRDGMAGLGVGGGYVNYIDPDMPDWAGAYYGANQARLAETAARYDPDAVFGFAQAVRA